MNKVDLTSYCNASKLPSPGMCFSIAGVMKREKNDTITLQVTSPLSLFMMSFSPDRRAIEWWRPESRSTSYDKEWRDRADHDLHNYNWCLWMFMVLVLIISPVCVWHNTVCQPQEQDAKTKVRERAYVSSTFRQRKALYSRAIGLTK